MNDKYEAPSLPIEDMLKRLNASSVFGEPTREGATTVIPVAEVMYGFGAGGGYGKPAAGETAEAGEEAAATAGAGEGGGSGGGGGGRAKPLGYIRLDADGAHFDPIQDQSRIALAGIAMVAWAIFWVTATIRAFVKK
jgi:uncharacterized spore protein YtfJ